MMRNPLTSTNVTLDYTRAGDVLKEEALPGPRKINLPSIINIEGDLIHTSAYGFDVVMGDSAKPVGINDHDLVLYDKRRKVPKIGEIVLINIIGEEKNPPINFGRHKVRIVRDVEPKTGELFTFTFDDEGNTHFSRPHQIEDVVGIVRYVIPQSTSFFGEYVDSL